MSKQNSNDYSEATTDNQAEINQAPELQPESVASINEKEEQVASEEATIDTNTVENIQVNQESLGQETNQNPNTQENYQNPQPNQYEQQTFEQAVQPNQGALGQETNQNSNTQENYQNPQPNQYEQQTFEQAVQPNQGAYSQQQQQYTQAAQQQTAGQYQQPGQQFTQEQYQARQQFTQGQNQQQNYQNNQQAQFQYQQGTPQNYQNPQPSQPNAFTKAVKEFWFWLLAIWKTPTANLKESNLNSYTVFGIVSLFLGIIIYQIKIISLPLAYYTGFAFDARIFLTAILAALLFLFSIVPAGFVVKRFVYKNKTVTFNNAFQWYSRFYALILPIITVALILSFLETYQLPLILLGLTLLVLSTGVVYTLLPSENKLKVDPFYNCLLAITVNTAIIVVFFWLALSMI
ncbi:MAG: hypothetical protein Q4A90_00355 [Streptococcus sp.]|nr:hypothetical protein [Streptococcus sp.]